MFNLTHSVMCALALASAPIPGPDSSDFAFAQNCQPSRLKIATWSGLLALGLM